MRFALILVSALSFALPAALPARAVETPFDAGLYRLAEILGTLHFLRNLCGEAGTSWRDEMEKLLASENPDAERRAKFIASFNRGYRSFQTTYTVCTSSAVEAINRYTREGETISSEIASRYGN